MAAFETDLGEILARARASGITDILTASTTLEDASKNLEIVSGSRDVSLWAAVGVHPHEAKGWGPGHEKKIEDLTRHRRVVAIGEAGLDYHYDLSPRERQRDVLARQVRLAARLRLPIVIHSREAADEVAAILEGEGAGEHGGVIHCFTEGESFARRSLELGFYISFSGIITFPKAEAIREVARLVPEERLLVETDAPYLAPAPHRGRRNEPAHAALVLVELARIRGAEPGDLAATITANFRRFIDRKRSEDDP
jgi:TatD DNase family protein